MTTHTDTAVAPDPTDTGTADLAEATPEPELVWISVHDLVPNPDNPRKNAGDLTEMVRSVIAKGVIEPVTCLPPDDDGKYMVVCGFRRRTATLKAVLTHPEVEILPAVVRPWSRAEALDAMLIENLNRESLTVSEQVAGIELAMSLDEGCTPARLCRRLGKSQAWVRTRMSLTGLPPVWREAIDAGRLTLASAEAIASAADLGPEHVETLCERMVDCHHHDPDRVVEQYREILRIEAEHDAVVAVQRNGPYPVFTADDPPPDKYKGLGEMFGSEGAKAHASEPCHAVMVRRPPDAWRGGKVTVQPICTKPRRHHVAQVTSGKGSDIASDRPARNQRGDDSHAKRKGRVARLAHGTEVFARARGGVSQRDLTAAAHRCLIEEADRDALAFAATILGHEDPRTVTAAGLLSGAETPAALARVAGAVAYGVAEIRMYWSPSGCSDYLAMLTGTGWTPDGWTAAVLSDHPGTSADEDSAQPETDEDAATSEGEAA
jgi:ParB/RepB/Spo0J family partition protein